jgi:hypothetical protein
MNNLLGECLLRVFAISPLPNSRNLREPKFGRISDVVVIFVSFL